MWGFKERYKENGAAFFSSTNIFILKSHPFSAIYVYQRFSCQRQFWIKKRLHFSYDRNIDNAMANWMGRYSAHATNGTSHTGLLFSSTLASMCSHINPVLHDPNKTARIPHYNRSRGSSGSSRFFSESFVLNWNRFRKLSASKYRKFGGAKRGCGLTYVCRRGTKGWMD